MTTLFFILFFGIAGLIGLWALACLISALIKKGPIGLFRSYIGALTGRDDTSNEIDDDKK